MLTGNLEHSTDIEPQGFAQQDRCDMQAVEVQEYARQLFEAHGLKAIAEAAQKARASEEQGDSEQAQTWRRVEAALMQMRGPHAS